MCALTSSGAHSVAVTQSQYLPRTEQPWDDLPMRTAVDTDDMPLPPPVERCSCCGRTDVKVCVRLDCHPEIGLCDRCLLWLNGRRMATAKDDLVSRIKNWRSSH